MIFGPGRELIVITRGPGKLSLLTSESVVSGVGNVIGAMPTNNVGITRWLISFGHTYKRFSFIWNGTGEAVYQIGNGLERKPVGRHWSASSNVEWGSSTVGTKDVSSLTVTALNRDGRTTVYALPDNL